MARKPMTEEQRQAARDRLALARAARKPKQTDTPTQTIAENINVNTDGSLSPAPSVSPIPGVSFTPEQFEALLAALGGGNRSAAASNAFTGGGLQTDGQGRVVGTKELYNPDPDYYPNPVPELEAFFESEPRYRQFAFSYNYYLTWEVTSKPYTTKDGFQQREPTFHVVLYATLYNDNGEDSGKYRVVQTLELNEDSAVALDWAAENGIEQTEENMREIMNRSRFERIKRWLISIFYTENNYGLNVQSTEEIFDGQAVRVITKSNVQGFNRAPKIDIEELK